MSYPSICDEFVNKIKVFTDSIIPSNYFLTKSMEFSKVTTSGTLWYLKKFLVLYDAIFLSRKIQTTDGIKTVSKIFDEYIETLPKIQRNDAKNFFYPAECNVSKKSYQEFAGRKISKMKKTARNFTHKLTNIILYILCKLADSRASKNICEKKFTQKNSM